MVNMRTVAAAAGVSVATISNVLNDPGKVAPERRSRYELHLPYTIVLRLGWGGEKGNESQRCAGCRALSSARGSMNCF